MTFVLLWITNLKNDINIMDKTGLERHEGEQLITEFHFFVNYNFKEGRINEFDADVIEKVV